MHTFFYCTHFPTLQKILGIFNTSKKFGHFRHFKKFWAFSTLQKNLDIFDTSKKFGHFRHLQKISRIPGLVKFLRISDTSSVSKSFRFLSHHEIFILQNLFTLETVKPWKLLHCWSYHISHGRSPSRWSIVKEAQENSTFFSYINIGLEPRKAQKFDNIFFLS